MNYTEILEGNKLIADFMGLKPTQSVFRKDEPIYRIEEHDRTFSLQPDGGDEFTPEEMGYSASWDWLMPVVDSILAFKIPKHNEPIVLDFIIQSSSVGEPHWVQITPAYKYTFLSIYADGATRIEAVYKAVFQFIKQYS